MAVRRLNRQHSSSSCAPRPLSRLQSLPQASQAELAAVIEASSDAVRAPSPPELPASILVSVSRIGPGSIATDARHDCRHRKQPPPAACSRADRSTASPPYSPDPPACHVSSAAGLDQEQHLRSPACPHRSTYGCAGSSVDPGPHRRLASLAPEDAVFPKL